MELAVDRGALPEGKAAAWIRMARQIYADPQLNRDEAIRSGSLAAMILMLAAEARGLASGALSGFDVERVRREFAIPERYVPVMLLSVGHVLGEPGPRQPRLPVEQVLAFDRCREF
jgi:nitroreductase